MDKLGDVNILSSLFYNKPVETNQKPVRRF